jgi:hypothetical protein
MQQVLLLQDAGARLCCWLHFADIHPLHVLGLQVLCTACIVASAAAAQMKVVASATVMGSPTATMAAATMGQGSMERVRVRA